MSRTIGPIAVIPVFVYVYVGGGTRIVWEVPVGGSPM